MNVWNGKVALALMGTAFTEFNELAVDDRLGCRSIKATSFLVQLKAVKAMAV